MESLLIDGHADIASIFAEESGIDSKYYLNK